MDIQRPLDLDITRWAHRSPSTPNHIPFIVRTPEFDIGVEVAVHPPSDPKRIWVVVYDHESFPMKKGTPFAVVDGRVRWRVYEHDLVPIDFFGEEDEARIMELIEEVSKSGG